MTPKLRIVHVINSFEYGGAEAMLCQLILRTDRHRFDPSVVALIDDLTVAQPILDAGVPLATMGMRPGLPDPRGLVRLARHLRHLRPDVIHTWMDHSNLIGGLAAQAAPGAAVVWGVHHSHHVPGIAKRSTLLTVRACALLSRRVPTRIVCCSEHSRRMYSETGFASERLMVIPNGFDTSVFRPDAASGRAIREELGVADACRLVGLVARYDPLKDHDTFFDAASRLARLRPDVRFVLCGHRVNWENLEVAALVRRHNLSDRVHLLGPRRDVARIYTALDLSTSSSISEAFPLAVGEAMACAVPCVVTDVGDSALIVGPTGAVVPPRDPAAMAQAWSRLLAMSPADRQHLGQQARRRVCERFDLGAIARRYERLYLSLCDDRAAIPEVAGETDDESLEWAAGALPGRELP